jgi:hypothetical protein
MGEVLAQEGATRSEQSARGIGVAKKSKPTARTRSGPRAPDGKAPLQVLVAGQTIEDAKVKAIRDKTSVSRAVEELLDGWLDGTYKLME